MNYVIARGTVEKDVTQSNDSDGVQGVFVGTFLRNLDEKRRLTIPSEWREQVAGVASFYVLPAVDQKYLSVLPAREMIERLRKIRGHSIADTKARQFARLLGARSDLVTCDTQGRIRIKDELLGFGELNDQVTLIGTFEGFELWNPELWKSSISEDQVDLGEAARYVGF